MKKFSAGQRVPETGRYKIVTQSGKKINRIYLNEGDAFPKICARLHYEDE